VSTAFLAHSDGVEAVVDLDAITANIRTLTALSAGSELMVVVKADAYGHGAVACAGAARTAGVPWVGVATIDEALELRDAGDTELLLSWVNARDARFVEAIAADVQVSSSSPELLDVLAAAARAAGKPALVHLAVDTGLGREGALPGAHWHELMAHAMRLQQAGDIEVTGVWSHLACADSTGHDSIDAQATLFTRACEEAHEAGFRIRYRHLANSAALLTRPDLNFDVIRTGMAVYGLPSTDKDTGVHLAPAMTLRTRVIDVKRLPAGHGIGYGHTYVTDRETTVALLPAGYADGLPRNAGNKPLVSINGRRYSIAGRVSMDQIVVDVGDHNVKVGDHAIFFGAGTNGEPTVQEWAHECDTIAYEIIARLGRRVNHTYVGGGIGGDL